MDINRRIELFKQGYWDVPEGLDTSGFDFNWRPDPYDRPYIHQFGTQWQKTGGPRFVIPENEGVKYQTHQHAIKLPAKESREWRPLRPNCSIDWSWHPDDTSPPYIYIFGNQWYDSETMPTIQYRVKGATEKKYINEVRAKLDVCMDRWVVPEDISSDFDFSWVPHPYDPPGLDYQFGTQWQKTGGPLYKSENSKSVKYVDVQRATKLPNKDNRNWRLIEAIDMESFDFSWHPDDTEEPYRYIFGNEYHSSKIMPTVMYKVSGATTVKHITDIKAKLLVEKVSFIDSIYDAVMEHRFDTGYVHFQNSQHPIDYTMFIPNYVDEKQYIHIIDNNSAIVPKGIKHTLYDKLTDYPYIKHDCLTYQKPIDIIFVSNGESCAEENYQRLVDMNLPNRLVRVDGVNGRVASQHAAANSSETPWYFLVNAKLKVDENFDFNWQPDIMKSRRHYIFRAKNPINGLVYGHMAMVANNKKLTLETKGTGLDFTMESPHEVVDILSGEAVFNSEWDVWRTAFRECLKLRNINNKESLERLEVWRTTSNGPYGYISMYGAIDAIRYFDEVNGDFDKIKLSYDWAWLRERFDSLYTK